MTSAVFSKTLTLESDFRVPSYLNVSVTPLWFELRPEKFIVKPEMVLVMEPTRVEAAVSN